MNDPYKVLNIPNTASDEEVKRAYRELARKYHPDNYHDNPLADLAQEKMKEINEAYDTITKARESGGSAQAEADAILSAAKTQAAEIISAARTKSYELEQEIAALESRYELMKTRVKLLLYAEIELLDKNEILAEKEANAETTK